MVELLIKSLLRHGIYDVTLSLGYLAELVQAYFQHRQRLLTKLNLTYVLEEQPSGTAGSLALVEGLDDTFLSGASPTIRQMLGLNYPWPSSPPHDPFV